MIYYHHSIWRSGKLKIMLFPYCSKGFVRYFVNIYFKIRWIRWIQVRMKIRTWIQRDEKLRDHYLNWFISTFEISRWVADEYGKRGNKFPRSEDGTNRIFWKECSRSQITTNYQKFNFMNNWFRSPPLRNPHYNPIIWNQIWIIQFISNRIAIYQKVA